MLDFIYFIEKAFSCRKVKGRHVADFQIFSKTSKRTKKVKIINKKQHKNMYGICNLTRSGVMPVFSCSLAQTFLVCCRWLERD